MLDYTYTENQFCTIDALWLDILDELNHGMIIESRVGKTKELLGYQGCLMSLDNTFLLNKRRNLSPQYAAAEFLWYLSNTRSIEMIKAYAPQYVNFSDVEQGTDNEIAYGAYGHRLATNITFDKETLPTHEASGEHMHQLMQLCHLLQSSPNSRQAIVTFWQANDLVHAYRRDKRDLPCTICLQFFVRDGALHCIATMRSNDVWLGTPYDIFCFTSIQRLIALYLDIPTGCYIHQVGSMHLYERNFKAADEAVDGDDESFYRKMHNYDHCQCQDLFGSIRLAVEAESHFRNDQPKMGDRTLSVLFRKMTSPNILTDAVCIVAKKWEHDYSDCIKSEIFKEVLC